MIQIRSCEGHDEMEACVQLQIETWGYDESDVVPRKMFLLEQKIGGQVIGAFETGNEKTREQGEKATATQGGGKLVGFALSLPGIKTSPSGPQIYLHSHMLAVKEGYRDRGIGAQLKRRQRVEALSRGIRHMEWTFDPLEIKNAFLNIHRLGAVARAYRPNFYGVSSSRLQGGLPTDRLVAEWELDSPRVLAILDGRPADGQIIEERIPVPASIYRWKATEADRGRALAIQSENRRKFQQAFSHGLAVVGFTRDAEGNGVFELGRLAQRKQDSGSEELKNL
jgi:predicted GNAT superfamily acetyltransferase